MFNSIVNVEYYTDNYVGYQAVGKMSALNMAMNGNAYKMIEIKKVSGPVVPLRYNPRKHHQEK